MAPCVRPPPPAGAAGLAPAHKFGRKTYRVLDTYIKIHSFYTVDHVSCLAVYGTYTAICV